MSPNSSRRPADRLQLLHGVLGALAVLTVAAALGAATEGCGDPNTGFGCQHPDVNFYNCHGEYDPCHCQDDAGSVGLRGVGACITLDDAGFGPCTTGSDGGDGGADGPIETCTG